MRVGLSGIMMGISVALALRNEKKLTPQVIRLSLTTELMTILIFGLIELS